MKAAEFIGGTFMAAVLCEQVAPGMRDSERCVSVRDVGGRREWVLVEHDFLAVHKGKTYLPIGVVQVDRDRELVLGGNRLWVRASELLEANGARS
jgi:hypothetical protein